MELFSLKPRSKPEDVKNFDTYKIALDKCLKPGSNINNIGIIGDYGTGKSTIINTYIDNHLDKSQYDTIMISLTTLEEPSKDARSFNVDMLKNIIRQVVHNPQKQIEYNILKFRTPKIRWQTAATIVVFIAVFLFLFFANTNLISSIPFVRGMLNLGIPIEAFRIIRYLLLVSTALLFAYLMYPKFLAGIKVHKFKLGSSLDAEVKRTTEDVADEELNYLEYLMYLLRRNDGKSLLLVIEDLDRFGNIRIFQQLREINNLLNSVDTRHSYKFLYAVGNSLFADGCSENNRICIKSSYDSIYKEKVTKFFDFVINTIPVMDSQNSYEFFKKSFPSLAGEDGIADEDLFMLLQYISSPRVIIDVANNFQMIKDMKKDAKGHSDVKLLYYSILKSRFHNFYKMIHEVFEDLELVAKYYSNNEGYTEIEKQRADDFYALCALYARENEDLSANSANSIDSAWGKIRNENDIDSILSKYPINPIYKINHGRDHVRLSAILSFAKQKNKEHIFSVDQYRRKIGAGFKFNTLEFANLIALYYNEGNNTISEIVGHVEVERHNNPNKINFSIREFLDIDFVKLGIKEKLLDLNDYTQYVTVNYLDANDANFIRLFNLFEAEDELFDSKLSDIDMVLSKMKLEKIKGKNGLNIYVIAHMQLSGYRGEKAERLKHNAINHSDFIYKLLESRFEIYGISFFEPDGISFSKLGFLLENASKIENQDSFHAVVEWFDGNTNVKVASGSSLEQFLGSLDESFNFSILGTDYYEDTYMRLIASAGVNRNEETLLFLLGKVNKGYKRLVNIIFKDYEPLMRNTEQLNHTKWLSLINQYISTFLSLLDKENIELMKFAYMLDKTVKIEELSDLTNDDFFAFIYENDLYNYSASNINVLLGKFDDESFANFLPFAEYSFENFEVLKNLRKINKVKHLDFEQPWASLLIQKALEKTHFDDFEGLLQFFTEANPFKINILQELIIDGEKLVVLFDFVDLYVHTFANMNFIYEVLGNLELSQPKNIGAILGDKGFNYDALYNDISLFNENADLKKMIFEGICQNESVSLDLFKKFMGARKDRVVNASILSSQDKLRALIEVNKLEMSVSNLQRCSNETLLYMHNEKADILNKAFALMTNEEIIGILKRFEGVEHRVARLVDYYSSSSAKDFIETDAALELAIQYLRIHPLIPSKVERRTVTQRVLDPLSPYNQDIKKIVQLLVKGEGQRTVSNTIMELAKLLNEKDITIFNEVEGSKILIKYS